MTMYTVTVQMPETLYRRLEQLATLSQHPLEAIIIQTLAVTIPSLPDDLSPAMRDALVSLEELSDDDLRQITRSAFPVDLYDLFGSLREKRRLGTITTDEQVILDQFIQDADTLALHKAYAEMLLKWRNHPLLALMEREA